MGSFRRFFRSSKAPSADSPKIASSGNISSPTDGNISSHEDGNISSHADGNISSHADGNISHTNGNISHTYGNISSHTDARIITTVSNTIDTLNAAAEHHGRIKDDKSLPETLHEASLGLPLVGEALGAARAQLSRRSPADRQGAASWSEACNAKALLFWGILKPVVQAPAASRSERYRTAVGQVGKGDTAEVLVMGMMNDVCGLARDCAMESAMRAQVEKLRGAVERLGGLEPSAPKKESGHTFYNSGSGTLFNASGGTQNNNTGGGNQFPGATFSGAVSFGSKLA